MRALGTLRRPSHQVAVGIPIHVAGSDTVGVMATQDPGSTTIKRLTPATWDLFAALVERHNGIFGGCWCVAFHPERDDHVPGYDGNRAYKKCLVEEGVAHAALVVRDGDDGEEAIAWAEYGMPAELPDIHHRKQYLAERDLEPDYRITCIFVDKRFRRNGLVTVALQGALDLIAQAGGGSSRATRTFLGSGGCPRHSCTTAQRPSTSAPASTSSGPKVSRTR